jgi:hypothetical protein
VEGATRYWRVCAKSGSMRFLTHLAVAVTKRRDACPDLVANGAAQATTDQDFVCHRAILGAMNWWRPSGKQALPVSDIDPPVELEADLAEMRDVRESQPLVQANARLIGQCDAANCGVVASILQQVQDPRI